MAELHPKTTDNAALVELLQDMMDDFLTNYMKEEYDLSSNATDVSAILVDVTCNRTAFERDLVDIYDIRGLEINENSVNATFAVVVTLPETLKITEIITASIERGAEVLLEMLKSSRNPAFENMSGIELNIVTVVEESVVEETATPIIISDTSEPSVQLQSDEDDAIDFGVLGAIGSVCAASSAALTASSTSELEEEEEEEEEEIGMEYEEEEDEGGFEDEGEEDDGEGEDNEEDGGDDEPQDDDQEERLMYMKRTEDEIRLIILAVSIFWKKFVDRHILTIIYFT